MIGGLAMSDMSIITALLYYGWLHKVRDTLLHYGWLHKVRDTAVLLFNGWLHRVRDTVVLIALRMAT